MLLLGSLIPLFSDNLPRVASFLPVSAVAMRPAFKKDGAALYVERGFGAPGILQPALASNQNTFASFFSDVNAKTFRLEALIILPGSKRYALMPRGEILNHLAYILNSVHSLEGINYWSESRKKNRTLFSDYYRIASADDTTKQLDPPASQVGAGKTWEFFAYQKDLTFSGLVVHYQIRKDQDFILMMNKNATPLKLTLIPVVAAGNMKNGILILPCAEGLLVYFAATIQAFDFAAHRVFESTENKSLAVLRWFAEKAAQEELIQAIELPMKLD